MVMSLSELREMVMDREVLCAAIYGVTKSRTWLSDWSETQSDHLFLKKKNPKPVTETPENFYIYINFMKQLKTNIEKKF